MVQSLTVIVSLSAEETGAPVVDRDLFLISWKFFKYLTEVVQFLVAGISIFRQSDFFLFFPPPVLFALCPSRDICKDLITEIPHQPQDWCEDQGLAIEPTGRKPPAPSNGGCRTEPGNCLSFPFSQPQPFRRPGQRGQGSRRRPASGSR